MKDDTRKRRRKVAVDRKTAERFLRKMGYVGCARPGLFGRIEPPTKDDVRRGLAGCWFVDVEPLRKDIAAWNDFVRRWTLRTARRAPP